jgi:hypothetical protein
MKIYLLMPPSELFLDSNFSENIGDKNVTILIKTLSIGVTNMQ